MPFGIALGAIGSIISSDNAADAADNATAAQSASAAQTAQLGQDQLSFAKQQYADSAGARDWALQASKDVTAQQLATGKQQADIAADYNDYNKSTFRPLEQKIVTDAQNYDTPERRAAAQESARADVQQAFGSNQAAMSRTIGRTGATVGGRALASMADRQYAEATTQAGATTQATRNVEQQGYARMADAANLGRNLPSAQATAASTSTQANSVAVGASQAGLNASNSGVGTVMSGYSGAIGASSSAGSLYGQSAGLYNSIANSNAAGYGALGNAAGRLVGSGSLSSLFGSSGGGSSFGSGSSSDLTFASMGAGGDGYYTLSDENTKSGTGKRMDTKKALAQIRDTPVDEGWKYDPAKGGPDEGGATHDGPMAQDVQASMGDGVAPGGRVIDMVSMNARLLAGLQEVAKRQDKSDRKLALMGRERKAA